MSKSMKKYENVQEGSESTEKHKKYEEVQKYAFSPLGKPIRFIVTLNDGV